VVLVAAVDGSGAAHALAVLGEKVLVAAVDIPVAAHAHAALGEVFPGYDAEVHGAAHPPVLCNGVLVALGAA